MNPCFSSLLVLFKTSFPPLADDQQSAQRRRRLLRLGTFTNLCLPRIHLFPASRGCSAVCSTEDAAFHFLNAILTQTARDYTHVVSALSPLPAQHLGGSQSQAVEARRSISTRRKEVVGLGFEDPGLGGRPGLSVLDLLSRIRRMDDGGWRAADRFWALRPGLGSRKAREGRGRQASFAISDCLLDGTGIFFFLAGSAGVKGTLRWC